MLESKLKRRYTWPVELLGVIVEDGEVIIGTEEQIFPDGQINSNFINLQHQQNLNLQSTAVAVGVGANNNVGLCLTKCDGATPKSDCDSHDNRKKNTSHPQEHSSSSRFGLLQIRHSDGGDTDQVRLLPTSSSSRRNVGDESENYSVFSPRIINIAGSHGRTQINHHSFCTCKSTNKHDDGIPCGGVINNECGGSSGTCAPEPNCAAKSRDHNGRYPVSQGQYDTDENFCVNNEVLQVQVSSLYPVTEEDVFTSASETIVTSPSSKKGTGSGTFQPIQDKFNFLRKKSRDSRKRKQQQQNQNEQSSSTSAAVSTSPKAPINNGHKDFCPHSKVFQVKSVSPPGKSSDSSSIVISKGEIIREYCSSVSASSNNNTPSHHSHLSSSHSTQPDSNAGAAPAKIGANCNIPAFANKPSGNVRRMSSVAGGNNNAQFGKGTALNGGNLNCKALHPETEGKIPAANGTATGAMALQVNTPNGDVKKVITLWQNYYPEGQWGWIIVFCALVVQAINHGFQLSFSTFMVSVQQKFQVEEPALLGLLGSFSAATSLFFSPLWVALCKQKSTRLAGVFGGLIASLGCLFTSFATQFHQLFISYGAFVGVGVGLTRDASTLMVGQYFKRKRDIVEILVVSGSGVGILFMSVSINSAIHSIGWRLGLQAVTGTILSTFFLGTCYRSASLYHPQRRAILHLKNQKRKVKVKDLARREDKPPLIDYSCLKSKTLQILLLSSAFTAFGINSPLYYLSDECQELDPFSFTLLHMYLGAAWVIGCCLFGLIVVQKSQECRVSKQYLCQVAGVICGISIMALIATNGHNGLVVFVWVYGFSFGGYSYSLKVYTYERVRARHFARAWSFVQWSQAVPVLVSIPLTGYLKINYGRSYAYSLAALSVFLGSASLFLTDVRRRRLSRRKAEKSSMKTCETLESAQSPKIRRLSFAFPMVEQMSPQSKHESGDGQGSQLDPALLSKELTCISEEGLADMDFQDIYFEDWAEFLGGDCITSCNKVENCLASEYDAEFALLLDRRVRRWSTARNSIGFAAHAAGLGTTASAVASTVAGLSGQQHSILPGIVQSALDGNGDNSPLHIEPLRIPGGGPREIPVFKNHPWGNRPPPAQRPITVIDEASV